MVKFCINCGRQLDEAAKFCAGCGAPQPYQQPQQPPPPQQYAPAPPPAMQQPQQQIPNSSYPIPNSPSQQPQSQPPQPAAQPYQQPQQQYQQPFPPQQAYQQPLYQQAQQYAPAPVAPATKKSKKPLIIGGVAGACVLALVVALITTNGFGLFEKSNSGSNPGSSTKQSSTSGNNGNSSNNSNSNSDDKDNPNNPNDQNDPNDPNSTMNTTGEDSVSINALLGTWGCRDNGGEHFYFNFKADGSFSYYKAMTYSTYSTFSSFTRYETFIKGKYRVDGYVIEFYGCQIDTHTGLSWKYFDVGSYLDLQYDFPFDTTPLEDPRERDGASMMFEFSDAMTLRFISESGIVWGNYDMDFQYMADTHNVVIPTHRIPVPDLEWPTDKLPPEVLEYTAGSIREIDDTSHNREVHIYIERTTREDLIDYGERLMQSGWERGAFSELLDGTGNALWLDMGGIHLHLYLRRDDYVEIAFWYGIGVEKYW